MVNNFDNLYSVKGDASYNDVLKVVQQHMAAVDGFANKELTSEETFRYKKHIEKCVMDNGLKCKGFDTLSALIERLYNSMTLFDVLTPFLEQKTYKSMGIEEIYGRWNCIYLLTKKGKIKLKETFPSPQSAQDILNRMCDKFNATVNQGTPTALGEFRPNIRISVIGSPITSEELGPEFNIRIVHGSEMTKKLLLESKTIDEKALTLLEICTMHKANICIAGATGSGKTGTMYYLLTHASENADKRVGTIEIECREFDLIKYDENGDVCNDVFHLVTRASDSDRYSITANDLADIILRFRPDILGMGEMRNSETLAVCELSITGHGVITTTHASNAKAAYDRMVMLCKKSGLNYDDYTLYTLVLQAFPIIVYQQQCDDGSRRVFEIIEGMGYQNNEVKCSSLFRYTVEDNVEEGKKSIGKFEQVGKISDRLRKFMINNGASRASLEAY